MPEMVVPASKSTGRRYKLMPVKLADYAADESIPWQRIILAEGAKGPIIADVKCVRCVYCCSSTKYGNYVVPKEPVWLYIRRYANGKIKYSLSDAQEDTPREVLDRVATMRWPIEQCFEECKSHLGMGHYETRSYLAWYRHMLFVMIAHLFTLILRIRFKKTVTLTMPMIKRLVAASLVYDKRLHRSNVFDEILYHLKRNMIAYLFHRKRALQRFALGEL
jgi:hypothetical protein